MSERIRIQRKKAGDGERDLAPPIVHEALRSPGAPLDEGMRFGTRAGGGHLLVQPGIYESVGVRLQAPDLLLREATSEGVADGEQRATTIDKRTVTQPPPQIVNKQDIKASEPTAVSNQDHEAKGPEVTAEAGTEVQQSITPGEPVKTELNQSVSFRLNIPIKLASLTLGPIELLKEIELGASLQLLHQQEEGEEAEWSFNPFVASAILQAVSYEMPQVRTQLGIFNAGAALYLEAEGNPLSPALDLGAGARGSVSYRISESNPLFFSVEGSVGLSAKNMHQPAQAEFTPFFWGASFNVGVELGSSGKTSTSDSPRVQPKLRVNQPGDIYEQEADRVAEQVMRMAAPEGALQPAPQQLIHRAPAELAAPAVTPPIEASIDALRGGGQPLDLETRAFMEPRFGQDFGHVRVHTDATAAHSAQAVSALAYTAGSDVVFGAGQYQPGTDAGRRLIAHELAHVVQQGVKPASSITPTVRRADMGREADEHGFNILPTSPLKYALLPLSHAPSPMLQKFDPPYHSQALREGLVATEFSAEQIGQIYAANWERDFSQGHQVFADIVASWKAIKLAAKEQRLGQAEIEAFESSAGQLEHMLSNPLSIVELVTSKSYHGYQAEEHMDATDQSQAMVEGVSSDILASRDYIKAQLLRAMYDYRGDMPDLVGPRPTQHPSIAQEAAQQARDLPVDKFTFPDDHIVASRPATARSTSSDVADSAAIEMEPIGITGVVRHTRGTWTSEVADALGRASHALEDFFSHSNFVELAIGQRLPGISGLKTGTFGGVDAIYSLSHKLHAVASEINAERALINEVNQRVRKESSIFADFYGGASQGTALGAGAGGLLGSRGGILGAVTGGAIGAIGGALAGGLSGVLTGSPHPVRDQAISPKGIAIIERCAEFLGQGTTLLAKQSFADPASHTNLAKDQPGDSSDAVSKLKTIKFQLALELAATADRMIIGAMPQVFEIGSPESAIFLLQEINRILDALIAPPSPEHPLQHLIAPQLAKAKQALAAAETSVAPTR